LGALVSDDVAAIAPLHRGDGHLDWADPTDPVWPPPGREDDLVAPATHWLVRYGAGLYGAALLPQGYDRTWLNRARIVEEGTGAERTPPPGTEEVAYTDPEGSGTWTAWR